MAEHGRPSGMISGWGIRMEIGKRFEAFLRAHYSDEIATVMQIAPDHLDHERGHRRSENR